MAGCSILFHDDDDDDDDDDKKKSQKKEKKNIYIYINVCGVLFYSIKWV